MKTANNILAHIKGQIDAAEGGLDNRFMSAESKAALDERLRVLRDLKRWIEKPSAYDADAFGRVEAKSCR